MDNIPCSALRAHLAETIQQLDGRDAPVVISRRGRPAAVLMSMAHYQRLQGGQNDLASALLAWRERIAAELAEDARSGNGADPIADPFADVRDRGVDGGRAPIDFIALMAEPAADAKARPRKKPSPTA